jgi:hypothetical protein
LDYNSSFLWHSNYASKAVIKEAGDGSDRLILILCGQVRVPPLGFQNIFEQRQHQKFSLEGTKFNNII